MRYIIPPGCSGLPRVSSQLDMSGKPPQRGVQEASLSDTEPPQVTPFDLKGAVVLLKIPFQCLSCRASCQLRPITYTERIIQRILSIQGMVAGMSRE